MSSNVDFGIRFESDKQPGRRRWSLQTTGAIDYAIAALIIVFVLWLAVALGLPSVVLHGLVAGL